MHPFRLTLSIVFLLYFSVRSTAQDILKQTRIDSVAIVFRNASSDIDQRARLVKRLNGIKTNPNMKVVLKAYTDTVGSVAYNKMLASQRLRSAWELVKSTPLSSVRTDSLNFNETRGRKHVSEALYRRVDILVYKLEPTFTYGTKIDLKIQFENKTIRMLPGSVPSAEKLLAVMQMDTTLTIELHGHVCCSPNQALSVQRAQAIQNYLVGKGIAAKRITCKGFSNTKPLVAEKTEADEAKNRRVEVIFIDPKKPASKK
jgi:outer membrane protein OmpA-like peptidoglycan-associated protein